MQPPSHDRDESEDYQVSMVSLSHQDYIFNQKEGETTRLRTYDCTLINVDPSHLTIQYYNDIYSVGSRASYRSAFSSMLSSSMFKV